MKIYACLACALLLISAAASTRKPVEIDNRTVIYMTYDDGPDTYTLALAQWLSQQIDPKTGRGIRATFFVNICRLKDANPPSGFSGNCFSTGSQDPAILGELVALGHELGNHTYDHVNLTNPALAPQNLSYQIGEEQKRLDPLQGIYHPFRAPYLSWTDDLEKFLRSDPYLSKLSEPAGCDVCGDGYIDGRRINGDWDCFADGYAPETCGQIYVDAIGGMAQTKNEIVVLMHDRPEFDVGSDKPLRMSQYVIPRLSPEKYRFEIIGRKPSQKAYEEDSMLTWRNLRLRSRSAYPPHPRS